MTPQDKARDRHYQKYFGISLDTYNELLARQSGNCGCCGRPAAEFPKRLSVDHSHTTGEIRGLLCFKCNHLLIGRHEDARLFQRAADYLSSGTGLFVPREFLKGQKKKRRRKRK